jgi:hypothetical protein
MKIFVAWQVDQLEGLTASALMADNVEELRQISASIRRGTDNVKAWAMAVGGSPILDLGTLGAVEVPADRMTELPAIAQKFEAICEGTMSIGVGMTLSEAYTAMRFSSIKGGNQISLYHVEMEDAVSEHGREEPDALAGLGKSSKTGQEEPTGFADGPEDEQPQAGGPTDAQHGTATPAEQGSPMAPPEQGSPMAPPDAGGGAPAGAGDPNGGQVQQPGGQEGGEEQQQDPRTAVVQALQMIKQQAPVLEQMKQTNPDAFEAVKAVVEAMIMMAQGMAASGGPEEGGGEEPVEKAEDLTKAGEQAESKHLKCVKCGFTQLPADRATDSKGCKGNTPHSWPTAEVAKADLPQGYAVGTQKDGKIKVQHKDPATGANGGPAWRSVRAGQIMSEDGHAISSRNPSGS